MNDGMQVGLAVDTRIKWIDTAKGIGIILIVLGHTLKGGFVNQLLYSFHVPLFFYLSGLTFHQQNSMDFWGKRIRRLYIPYLYFSVISIVLFTIAGDVVAKQLNVALVEGGFTRNVLGMLYGNSRTGYMKWNVPLWFIPCMLAVFLLANLTEYICSKSGEGYRYFIMALSLGLELAYSAIFISIKLPFAFETAIFMLFFFECGVLSRKYQLMYRMRERLCGNKIKCAGLILLGLCLLVTTSYFNGFAQVRTLQFGKSYLLYIIGALCGIAMTVIVSNLIENSRVLSYIGENSMKILLMHKFPILFFQSIFPPTKKLLLSENTMVYCLCIAFVVAITIVGCLLMGNVIEKVFPIMVGKTKNRNRISK